MLLVFTAAVSTNLLRGRIIDCGCAGAATPQRISWSLVARDTVLSGLALLLLVQTVLGPRGSAPSRDDQLAVLGTVILSVLLERLVSVAIQVARAASAVGQAGRPA